ncbi:MAG: ribosome silencing factor [Gammaproteobacteria bacterium]
MTEYPINHELADLVTAALEDGKAIDIKRLEVTKLTTITDYMIVASGSSNRQIRALTERVIDAARETGVRPLGREGEQTGEWVLVDFGDVVLHLMQPETREFYQLEKLWESPPAETQSM